jgi:hypothetical protein
MASVALGLLRFFPGHSFPGFARACSAGRLSATTVDCTGEPRGWRFVRRMLPASRLTWRSPKAVDPLGLAPGIRTPTWCAAKCAPRLPGQREGSCCGVPIFHPPLRRSSSQRLVLVGLDLHEDILPQARLRRPSTSAVRIGMTFWHPTGNGWPWRTSAGPTATWPWPRVKPSSSGRTELASVSILRTRSGWGRLMNAEPSNAESWVGPGWPVSPAVPRLCRPTRGGWNCRPSFRLKNR